MKLPPLEQKILTNIQLGVIVVNCSTPGYIFGAFMNSHITTKFTYPPTFQVITKITNNQNYQHLWEIQYVSFMNYKTMSIVANMI